MVQQSANPMFGNSGFGFLPGPGSYSFMLQVFDKPTIPSITAASGSLLTSVSGQIDVIPEPGTMTLLLAAVIGIGLLNKGKQKHGRAVSKMALVGIRQHTGQLSFSRYGAAA
jgi:hypothetical protein